MRSGVEVVRTALGPSWTPHLVVNGLAAGSSKTDAGRVGGRLNLEYVLSAVAVRGHRSSLLVLKPLEATT